MASLILQDRQVNREDRLDTEEVEIEEADADEATGDPGDAPAALPIRMRCTIASWSIRTMRPANDCPGIDPPATVMDAVAPRKSATGSSVRTVKLDDRVPSTRPSVPRSNCIGRPTFCCVSVTRTLPPRSGYRTGRPNLPVIAARST